MGSKDNIDYKEVLKSGLNRLYADRVSRVVKETLMVYSNHNFELVKEALWEWEQQGSIRILMDISSAEDDQECVELFSFIP